MTNTIEKKFRVKPIINKQGDIQVYEIQKQRSPFMTFLGFPKYKDYIERIDTSPEGGYYEAKFFAYKNKEEAEENCELLNQDKRKEVTPSRKIEIDTRKGFYKHWTPEESFVNFNTKHSTPF